MPKPITSKNTIPKLGIILQDNQVRDLQVCQVKCAY
jgi:hypothetical protein